MAGSSSSGREGLEWPGDGNGKGVGGMRIGRGLIHRKGKQGYFIFFSSSARFHFVLYDSRLVETGRRGAPRQIRLVLNYMHNIPYYVYFQASVVTIIASPCETPPSPGPDPTQPRRGAPSRRRGRRPWRSWPGARRAARRCPGRRRRGGRG